MNLQEIIQTIDLSLLTNKKDFSQIQPASAYCADLLSCVMAGAKHQSIWITLQCHNNIVAVAALLDLSAIIITEGALPDQDTIDKANEEGVTLLGTSLKSFEVCGKIWELGLRD
jgi:hypothetical protein